MVWEWRVFYHGPGLDVWQLLKARPWSTSPDRRTDLYLVCTAGAGVKLRGQRTLEVKLRVGRHECGAEQWEKVLHMAVRWDGRDTKTLGAAAAEASAQQRGWIVQRKGSDSEMVKALEEVVALGGEERIELVPLKKARVSHHVRGVAIEQTDITMEGLPGAVWRSVCVEGELQDIIRILRERVGGTSGDASLAEHLVRVAEGGMACGYPEFIAKLKEKSKQATCK